MNSIILVVIGFVSCFIVISFALAYAEKTKTILILGPELRSYDVIIATTGNKGKLLWRNSERSSVIDDTMKKINLDLDDWK